MEGSHRDEGRIDSHDPQARSGCQRGKPRPDPGARLRFERRLRRSFSPSPPTPLPRGERGAIPLEADESCALAPSPLTGEGWGEGDATKGAAGSPNPPGEGSARPGARKPRRWGAPGRGHPARWPGLDGAQGLDLAGEGWIGWNDTGRARTSPGSGSAATLRGLTVTYGHGRMALGAEGGLWSIIGGNIIYDNAQQSPYLTKGPDAPRPPPPKVSR